MKTKYFVIVRATVEAGRLSAFETDHMTILKTFNHKTLSIFFFLLLTFYSCKKDPVTSPTFHYYEVGFKGVAVDWRDSSFVIATNNAALITEIESQLALPVDQRKIVSGQPVSGNGGYNKNADHQFKWHFKEDDWILTQLSAEIYDGRPYSDVDNDLGYWLNNMKRFAPWGSYIKREIAKP